MRLVIYLFFGLIMSKFSSPCRFARTFYQNYSNIFQLDQNETSLTIRPIYALSNQSFSTLSIGIIYQLADIYLVPVPLLFQCSSNERILPPIDCEFTIIDTRTDLSIRKTEPTRMTTVPLHFQGHSLISIRGAYFKQSTIALRNCRLDTQEDFSISQTFHLHIEFEQTINSSCQNTCNHPELYQCSSISHTCQCRAGEISSEKYEHLCVDTELTSNCSLTPERCRRLCRRSHQIDHHCQCPLGSQRTLSNNIYHCNLAILSQCNDNQSSTACSNGYICQDNRCVRIIFSLPFLLIVLLFGALLIIISLIIALWKMRSIRCVKFVVLSTHSTKKTCEKYRKINLFE